MPVALISTYRRMARRRMLHGGYVDLLTVIVEATKDNSIFIFEEKLRPLG